MRTQTHWHIPGLLPAGELLTLDGAPRVGKTLLATHWAAQLSHIEGQSVLYLHDIGQTEAALTFLNTAGYTRERVIVRQLNIPDTVPGTKPACVFPHVLAQLRQQVDEHQPTIVVVDGFDDLLDAGPDVNPHEARRLWRELYDLVKERDITVLLTRSRGLHEPRTSGNLTKAALRVLHHGLTLGWHPYHENQRILSIAHNQFGPSRDQYHLTIGEDGDVVVRARLRKQHVQPARSPSPWRYCHFREQRLAACVDFACRLIADKALEMNVLTDALHKMGFTRTEIHQALERGNFGLRTTHLMECYITAPAHFEVRKKDTGSAPATAQKAAAPASVQPPASTLPAPRFSFDFKRRRATRPIEGQDEQEARDHSKSISDMMLQRARHPDSPTAEDHCRAADAIIARADYLRAKLRSLV